MKINKAAITAYWDVNKISTQKNIDDVAKEFEATFVKMILKEFRKTIPEGIFGNSFSSKMYLDMFDMALSEKISESDALGLQSFIKEAVKSYTKYSGDK